MSRTVDWDAVTYDRVADPQEEWARDVIARLNLEGTEHVLDAGCGSGRVTRQLLDLLPSGRVLGVDGSPAMIEQARGAIGGDPRVELRVSDLVELRVTEPLDAVFSNATFHWILDHDRLFRRLFAVLRPGGRLETQCGGEGNVARLATRLKALEQDDRYARYLRDSPPAWNFASVEDTRRRLVAAGFDVRDVWLERKPVTPPEPRNYVRVACSTKHVARLPAELREEFLDALLESMGTPLTLEYVRLNISATRPA